MTSASTTTSLSEQIAEAIWDSDKFQDAIWDVATATKEGQFTAYTDTISAIRKAAKEVLESSSASESAVLSSVRADIKSIAETVRELAKARPSHGDKVAWGIVAKMLERLAEGKPMLPTEAEIERPNDGTKEEGKK